MMRLRLDLDGILLHLCIKGYVPSSHDVWDAAWCRVDFSLSAADWLNYHRENDELLLSCEVEGLAKDIERLLRGELTENLEYSIVEQEFSFILHPKEHRANESMDWMFSFWHEGLTANFLSVTLDRDDLHVLLVYLKFVIGKHQADSPEVIDLIHKGYLTL